jgi:hypothetical protein
MKIEIITSQRTERKKRSKLRKRDHCPKCGSQSLLEEGPDQFCCECSWDTCFEYVERGLMNNLSVAALEHFGDRLAKNSNPPERETSEEFASA